MKSSGCCNGSSTISLIALILVPSPPTSSYVNRGFLSPVVSVRMVRLVERSIFTILFGEILLILNSIELPRIITEISSLCARGNPFNLFLTKSVNSLSIVTVSFTGIKTTVFATLLEIFLILTISFNDAPAFFLV